MSGDEIVELAVQSNARRLVASHLYREIDSRSLQKRARDRGWQGELLLGRDGMEIEIPTET